MDSGNQIIKNFKNPFCTLKHYKPAVNSYRSHMFSFEVWKKSIFSKFFTECVIVLALAIYFQIAMTTFLKDSNELIAIYLNMDELETSIRSDWNVTGSIEEVCAIAFTQTWGQTAIENWNNYSAQYSQYLSKISHLNFYLGGIVEIYDGIKLLTRTNILMSMYLIEYFLKLIYLKVRRK